MDKSSEGELWRTALSELRLQMTSATFNTWLAGSKQLGIDDEVLVVGVRNAYAVDWLQHRLYDVVSRTVTAVAGYEYRIVFEVMGIEGVAGAVSAEVLSMPLMQEPQFPGFEPIRSNFTQVPRQFFEVVLRVEPPVVIVFVAAVIDQTYGVITNYHTGERREWWEASSPEIGRVCGIKSKASVLKAVKGARKNGYVIRAQGTQNYRYRLRRIGESVDWSKK